MKHAFYSAIALGVVFAGCGESAEQQQAKGSFLIIEEYAPKKYRIKEEFPAEETRVVLKQFDGTERVLTKAELDELIRAENAKIEDGQSSLTNAQIAPQNSLGEVLLSSVAGALIGSWIGNKLFNSPHFNAQKASHYSNPSAYSRSVNSFNKTQSSGKSSAGKSGFFKSAGSNGMKSTGSSFGG